MDKKILTTIITTIVLTLLFIFTKNLIFGIDTDYIEDYMPGGETEVIIIGEKSEPTDEFPILATQTALERLSIFIIVDILFSVFYTKILFKKNLYTTQKDILYSIIVFIVPLIICYFLIYNQLGYTC